MQLKSILPISTLMAIVAAAPASVKTFGLLTIHSGSDLQYALIYNDNDSLYAGSLEAATFVINDNALVDYKSGKYISLDENNNLIEGNKKSNDFSINSENNLVYKGKESFIGCPVDGKYRFSVDTSCDGGIGIRVKAEYLTSTPSTTTESTSTPTKSSIESSTESDGYFGVITIRSGSDLQYNSIMKVESHPHVFSVGGVEGTVVEFKLNEDGTLVDQDNTGVFVDSNTGEVGNVDPWGEEKPSTGFTISETHLTYNGNDFLACPSGEDKYSLSVKECEGGLGIALRVVESQNA